MKKSIEEQLKKIKPIELVEVCWYDIFSWGGWQGLKSNSYSGPATCKTYGFLSKLTYFNKCLCAVISSSVGTNPDTNNEYLEYGQHMTIPVSVIYGVKKIKL